MANGNFNDGENFFVVGYYSKWAGLASDDQRVIRKIEQWFQRECSYS